MKTISIVGNTNVGKSTLFNRFVHSNQRAIASDYAGVTRDYKVADGNLANLKFKLIDTAGLSTKISNDKDLKGKIDQKTLTAISNSDLVLFVVDSTLGVTQQDKFVATWLKKRNLLVIIVINKIDVKHAVSNVHEFYQLGYKTLCEISAEHNLGFSMLGQLINNAFNNTSLSQVDKGFTQKENQSLKIAIIGRPNVGKSTLINAFLNESRVITGEEEGITRDSIFIDMTYKGKNIQLIDTAGVRKRKKIKDKIEKLSIRKSIEAIAICDIAVLVVGINDILKRQDLKLANIAIQEKFKPLLIAINKADLVKTDKKFLDNVSNMVQRKLSQIAKVKIIYISALAKKNIDKIIDESIVLYKLWNIKIPTSKLNNWLQTALEMHQPPLSKLGRRIKIKFISQIGSSPPSFQIFSNYAQEISDQYLKYLTNSLQEHFKLYSIPIKILLIKPRNPYSD